MTFNDTSSTLRLLLSRRSGKARDLSGPGPTDTEWHDILSAAIRVPDHGKLAPWRLVDIAQNQRMNFADKIEAAYILEKLDSGAMEITAVRNYAVQAPRLVAVLSCPKKESHIPLWEQHLSAGAVCQNILIAAHALGYLGNWLTGWPSYSAQVLHALGGSSGDQIAGFMYIGSCSKTLEERPRPDFATVVTPYQS
jgi:nitroreductase